MLMPDERAEILAMIREEIAKQQPVPAASTFQGPWFTAKEARAYVCCKTMAAWYVWRNRHGIVPRNNGSVANRWPPHVHHTVDTRPSITRVARRTAHHDYYDTIDEDVRRAKAILESKPARRGRVLATDERAPRSRVARSTVVIIRRHKLLESFVAGSNGSMAHDLATRLRSRRRRVPQC